MSKYILIKALPKHFTGNKEFNRIYKPGIILNITKDPDNDVYYEVQKLSIYEQVINFTLLPKEIDECFKKLKDNYE